MQVIEFARRLDAKTAAERLNLQNSLLISLLAGNLTVETGSTATASATTQSAQSPNPETLRQKPALSGLNWHQIFDARSQSRRIRKNGGLVSGQKNSVPGGNSLCFVRRQ